VKNLKNGKVSKIFLADNCPDQFKDQVKGYDSVEIIELKEPSKELALICKKKFLINIVSAVKK
jgi:ribosomal protein L30E